MSNCSLAIPKRSVCVGVDLSQRTSSLRCFPTPRKDWDVASVQKWFNWKTCCPVVSEDLKTESNLKWRKLLFHSNEYNIIKLKKETSNAVKYIIWSKFLNSYPSRLHFSLVQMSLSDCVPTVTVARAVPGNWDGVVTEKENKPKQSSHSLQWNLSWTTNHLLYIWMAFGGAVYQKRRGFLKVIDFNFFIPKHLTDHLNYSVVCSVTWPLNGSDLTTFVLWIKLFLYMLTSLHLADKNRAPPASLAFSIHRPGN